MRFARCRLSVVSCLFAALPLFAEQKTPPPPAPARPIHWPAMQEHKLENGLTVVLVPLQSVPKISAELTFLAGRGTDARLHPGVAQLAGRVLTEGTATRSSRQLKDALRAIGGTMSVDVDNDATTVSASSLSEFVPQLFALLSDVAAHASYPKSEVDLAKTNFAQEIEEQRSEPQFLAEEQLARALFGSHPYGFTVPQPAAIGKIDRDALRQFAATHYVPNNAHLIVVGDFDPATVLGDVQKAFASWKQGTAPALESPALPKRDKRQIYFVDRPGSVQSVIALGVVAPPRKSAGYVPLRIATTIFGGAFYSRLTRNIREQKGYTYSPFAFADLRRRGGEFVTGAAVRNEVTGPTILEILYELDRMRVLPVTSEELEGAKLYSIGSMALELESQSGLATRINTIYNYDLPHDFLQTFGTRVTALTPADIQKAAVKYFDTYHGAFVIVGDYAQVKEQIVPFADVTLVKE